MSRFVVVRAGGFMTVAAGRSVIWSTAAARRCCYGPSGRFVCNHCGKRHMETHPQLG